MILADRLSATEREDEEREAEDFIQSPLVSTPFTPQQVQMKEHRYKLTALNFDRDTIIPKENVNVDQDTLQRFMAILSKKAFR